MNWENILKAPTSQGNKTKRALELSVKDLINEFVEDKDSFDRRELEQHIRDNLVERVKSDGNLVNMISENQIPKRTNSYLRTHLEKLMIHKWTRYMQQIGFSWNRESNTFTRNSISKANRGSAKQRRTNRIIYKSAKSLTHEFIQGRESFNKKELEQYIKNNLLDKVNQDGELAKVVSENYIPRRVKNYLQNLRMQPFHTYVVGQGYTFTRTTSGERLGGDFIRISKAKLPAVKTQRYRLYETFIKKILRDEGGAAGMKNFIEAGDMINGFDKKYLNYVISDALDHGDWLAEHEYGDFYLKE